MNGEDPRARPAIDRMTLRLIDSGMDPKQARAQAETSVRRVIRREKVRQEVTR